MYSADESITTMTSKGQVTIPKVVRDAAGITYGQQVIVTFEKGQVVIKPKPTNQEIIAKLREISRKYPHKQIPFPSDEEIGRVAAEGAVARYQRYLDQDK